jgi:SanA protein
MVRGYREGRGGTLPSEAMLKAMLARAAREQLYLAPDHERPWLIVLGALVAGERAPPLLARRLECAASAYHQGAAPRVLVTGDDGRFRCDEVGVMVRALERAGVPPTAIAVDGGAHRTLASLDRARSLEAVRSAWLVSQREHLWRALWQARVLGIDAAGLIAEEPPPAGRRRALKRAARESAARARAVVDLGWRRLSSLSP